MLTTEERERLNDEIRHIENQLKYGWQSTYCNAKDKHISFPYAELGDDVVFVKCEYGVCENIEVEAISLEDCKRDRIAQHKKAVEIFKERGWSFSETNPRNICPTCARMLNN